MAYTTIDNPTDYFNTKLWTGNGGTQSITGIGYAPDFVWIKKRTDADGARIFDTVRGAAKGIFTNTNGAESTTSGELTAFDSDGFTLGASDAVNGNTKSYVSWNWLAGGSASSNTDGSITSSVSANTTAGFSIVSWTGTGANATIGHGLGVAPSVVITKNRTNSGRNWIYGGDNIGWTKYIIPNLTNAVATANNAWNDTAPTSTVASLGSSTVTNESSAEMIAYCFAEKKGYSKFGSYTGNGNADGTFVHTGFSPSWVMVKRSDGGTENWQINDNKRKTFNVNSTSLFANLNNAESTDGMYIDMLSNGFKARETGGGTNGSGSSYIYMAFAQSPFVTAGTKAAGTAR
jgi:hypothetical protein